MSEQECGHIVSTPLTLDTAVKEIFEFQLIQQGHLKMFIQPNPEFGQVTTDLHKIQNHQSLHHQVIGFIKIHMGVAAIL